jgi:hypothetical protein
VTYKRCLDCWKSCTDIVRTSGAKLSALNLKLLDSTSQTSTPAHSVILQTSSRACSPPPSPCTDADHTSAEENIDSPTALTEDISNGHLRTLSLPFKLTAPQNLRVPYPQGHNKEDPMASQMERTEYTEKYRGYASRAYVPKDFEDLEKYVSHNNVSVTLSHLYLG